ncbi:hypothetical protein CC80DRAFT_531253 [Byssothecium circinans]|uniref:Uncharacterized protein n=1 Tax=Byssothecium circinans TaxID=147558 RepID=A0A6A5UAZ3_9PLEO|nr:hypothetical protein CC80DRAFT_531253 [Byssothecium circinans]
MLDLFLMKPPDAEEKGEGQEQHQNQARPSGSQTPNSPHQQSYESPNPRQHFSRHNTPSTSSTYPPSQPASSPESATSPSSPTGQGGYAASSPQNYYQQTPVSGQPYTQQTQNAYAYSQYPSQASYPPAIYTYTPQPQATYASYPTTTVPSNQPGYPQYSTGQYTAMRHLVPQGTPQLSSGYNTGKEPVSYSTSPYPASSYTTSPYPPAPTYQYAPHPSAGQYPQYTPGTGSPLYPPQGR